MKHLRILGVILLILAMLPLGAFGASAETEKVVYVRDSGNDMAAGSATDPVATLRRAFTILAKTGGVAVVSGVLSITADNCEMPANDKPITVTSNFGGVDYRTQKSGNDKVGARILLLNGAASSFNFGGDVCFDYINFAITSKDVSCPIIATYYNNFEIGAHCATLYQSAAGVVWYDGKYDGKVNANTYAPILLIGANNANRGDVGGHTWDKDCVTKLGSGDWQSVRVGDRVAPTRNTITSKIDVQITGGRYCFTTHDFIEKEPNCAIQLVHQANTADTCEITLTVTGGEFIGEISAFGQIYTGSSGNASQKATININLLGGTFDRRMYTDGSYIIPAMIKAGTHSSLTYDGAKVNIAIDPTKLAFGAFAKMTILERKDFPVTVRLASADDRFIINGKDTVTEIGPLACTETAAPETTAAPTTTEEPEPPALPASRQTERAVFYVLFAAALACVAAVLIVALGKPKK